MTSQQALSLEKYTQPPRVVYYLYLLASQTTGFLIICILHLPLHLVSCTDVFIIHMTVHCRNTFNSSHAGKKSTFCYFCCLLILFSKLTFLKHSQSVKQFGPRSGQFFVWHDLGPNYMKRLSADKTSR